jgi:hypothetical protein
VKRSAAEVGEVPFGVETVTSTTPAAPAGDVAVQVVVDAQLTALAALPPKATVLEPTTKPAPVIVTLVPPASGPDAGEMALTAGPVV